MLRFSQAELFHAHDPKTRDKAIQLFRAAYEDGHLDAGISLSIVYATMETPARYSEAIPLCLTVLGKAMQLMARSTQDYIKTIYYAILYLKMYFSNEENKRLYSNYFDQFNGYIRNYIKYNIEKTSIEKILNMFFEEKMNHLL